MNSSRLKSAFRAGLAMVVAVTLVAPVSAQEKKKKDNQSEQAQKAIQKQKDIAKGLADKAAGDPAVLQKQLDEAKAALQAEKDRHTAELAKLNGELKTATDAGQNGKVKTTEKAIEKENDQYNKKIEKLQKDIDAAQAKVDGK
ncbi:hypothetical protein [Humisphaera borealis]|uniref:Uncharacterized protein n=1 Tax=Humisphaera borealis TaxID=2807512 RepID=A0A7M2WZ51_9BACT|nr:hypothetical protein [Humisphaera borealis]QOV90755.1 hypothetical protein IPV69_05185 [Humisphaera borealis]